MADVYEQNLPQKTNLTTNDYVRVVGSDDVSYKQPLSDVAQKTIENYAGSTLAGSTQSVKGAIDGLKSSATADKAELNASINEVASDLASESSTRASQDTNLQAQINQLVAPTGTAPNPAEIENARIGADNVTYTTLGDAIRTQFTNLKSDLTLAFDMGAINPTLVRSNYAWMGNTDWKFQAEDPCVSYWFHAKKGVRYHFEASGHSCFGVYAFPKFNLSSFPTEIYGLAQILQDDTRSAYDYVNEDYECLCFYVNYQSGYNPTVNVTGEYVSSVIADKATISYDEVGKSITNEYTPILGFIYDTGAVDTTANEYNRTTPIAVSKGDTVTFSCICWADTSALAFSADGNTWTCALKGINGHSAEDYSYTFKEDGYMSISYDCTKTGLTMFLTRYETDGLIVRMNEVEKTANSASNAVGVTLDSNEYTSVNGYITVDGVESTGDSYGFKRTEPIQVHQGDIIEFTLGGYYDSPALSFKSALTDATWATLLNGTFADITGTSDFEYTFTEDGYIVLSYYATYGLDMTIYHPASKGLFTKVEALSNAVDAIDAKTVIMNRRYSNFKDFGTQPPANGASGSFCNMSQGYDQLLADVYEPLRSAHPDYITRENVGKDASGTYDMYIYTFKPRYYQQSILLVAGIHADEPDAIASLARIMQLICTSDDEDLKFIRENVKVTVIPCVNVWGFSQSPKKRTNADNVEIQTQWHSDSPIAEVANLRPKILALKDELSFIQDMHTTTNNTYLDFYGVINKHGKNVRTIFRTNAWLCEQYAQDGRTVDDQYIGYLDGWGGLLSNYFFKEGFTTSTLELSDYHWDSSLSTSPVITMGVTMFLNYIIQQINDFYISMYDIPESDYRPSRP